MIFAMSFAELEAFRGKVVGGHLVFLAPRAFGGKLNDYVRHTIAFVLKKANFKNKFFQNNFSGETISSKL